MRLMSMILWLAAVAPAAAQGLGDAAQFGAVATMAPLCGLRDEAWSDDLREAAFETAAASQGQAAAAIAYGDMEALEDFAADSPAVACSSLAANPALRRADQAVARLRQQRDGKPIG